MVEERAPVSPPAPPTAATPAATAGAGGRALLLCLAAWLVPGAGHALLGRFKRAAAFLVLVSAMLAVGWSLDGNLHRRLPDQPLTVLTSIGAMGMGAPYFLLRYVAGYEGDVVAPGYEYGSAFVLTAGLMNLLLVLDTWDIARGRKD